MTGYIQTPTDLAESSLASTRHPRVRLATTTAEKEEIYRLRYDVYIEEMGGRNRHTEADFAARQLRDDWDDRAYHFYVRQNGKIVACGRHNLRTEGPLECEDQFEMKKFAPVFPNHVSLTSRLTLHPRIRGSHLLKQLTCAMYEFLCERGIRFDFLDCHPRLLPLYSRLGFQIYRPGFNHPKYTYVIPMVLVVNDLEHLERIKSPFVPIAHRFPHSPYSRELLSMLFPDAAHRFVSADLNAGTFWEILRRRLLAPCAPIARCDLLADLTEEETKLLMSLGHIVSCKAGDAVLTPTAPSREIFLILDGSFQVVVDSRNAAEDKSKFFNILSGGDIFGEIRFLKEHARYASVTALEDSTLLILNAKALDRLVITAPKASAKVFRNLARIVVARLSDLGGV